MSEKMGQAGARLAARPAVHVAGVGTATTPTSYSQAEVLKLLGYDESPLARRFFGSPHIEKRHLMLPQADPGTGRLPAESQRQLLEKFRWGALEIGAKAIALALDDGELRATDVDAIVCVTSTGFMVPGLSALFLRHLGMNSSCWRADIVGMGCNAGLNGLAVLDGWLARHSGARGVLVCCEINSAIYCGDSTPRDWIVNSLFGDGAASLVLSASTLGATSGPVVLDFESHILTEQAEAMRFDWHDERACWRFFLSKDIPYILGANVPLPLDRLLERNELKRSEIAHWIIHTGGGAIIDEIKEALGLTENQLRHTRSVLRDYGNLSSASFLFSFERLRKEGAPKTGDHGVMITMGPGAQIESALLKW